jgi:hypothetical protein
MPSGGFIQTDRSQVASDIKAGLVSLTLQQVIPPLRATNKTLRKKKKKTKRM